MKKQKGHLIKTVKPDSIAEEMGIEPGDRLLEINGETVEDIFDYQYMIEEEYVEAVSYTHLHSTKPMKRDGSTR